MKIVKAGKAAVSGFCKIIPASLLATTALGAGIVMPTSAHAQARAYNVPAGPLAVALNRLGEAADVEIIYDAALTNGIASAGLQGSYGPAEALSRLLAGTGLTFRQSGARSYTLEKAPKSAEGSIQLGPVRVEGNGGSGNGYSMAGDPAATEGSGSYAQKGPSATATRLGLTLRETPQSVTIVTRQKMDDKAYQTLDQAIVDSPGMSVSNGLGNTRYNYYSRGMEVNNIQYDGMSTSVYYLTRDAEPADDLDLYDRVEILRGAAGLTSGSGNPSGAINLIRKRPLAEARTRVDLSASSFGNGKILVDTSQPLNADHTIRGRFVGSFLGGGSYIDHTSSKIGTVYGVVDADLGKNTTVSLAYSYKKERLNGYDWTGLVVRPDGSFFNFDASTFLGNASDYADRHQHAAYANLEHRFDNGWALKSSGRASWSKAYMETNSRSYSYDASEEYYRRDVRFDYRSNVYSLDVNLSGPVELFGRSHDVVIGFNGARSDLTVLTVRPSPNVSVLFDPESWDPTTPSVFTSFAPTAKGQIINEQYGIYGQTRFNITDAFKFLAGGRLSWYTDTNASTTVSTGQYSATKMKENAQFVPYLGAVYDLTGHTSAYASFTSIFTPQSS